VNQGYKVEQRAFRGRCSAGYGAVGGYELGDFRLDDGLYVIE